VNAVSDEGKPTRRETREELAERLKNVDGVEIDEDGTPRAEMARNAKGGAVDTEE
jgi:hypothetical protein